MIVFSGKRLVRLAAVGAIVAALGLSACGRKGPLDPPPGAAIPKERQAADQAPIAVPGAMQPKEAKRKRSTREPAAAAKSGEQRSFFLDWLLD